LTLVDPVSGNRLMPIKVLAIVELAARDIAAIVHNMQPHTSRTMDDAPEASRNVPLDHGPHECIRFR
jgi:hypothetical protein